MMPSEHDQGEDRVLFVGPVTEHRVVVDGKEVPHLAAHMQDGGKVLLVCDHAVALELPVGLAEQVADFVSFAMQVAIRGARWTPVHEVTGAEATDHA